MTDLDSGRIHLYDVNFLYDWLILYRPVKKGTKWAHARNSHTLEMVNSYRWNTVASQTSGCLFLFADCYGSSWWVASIWIITLLHFHCKHNPSEWSLPGRQSELWKYEMEDIHHSWDSSVKWSPIVIRYIDFWVQHNASNTLILKKVLNKI